MRALYSSCIWCMVLSIDIYFFCSGFLTRGRKFLFCCNNLNSTSAGSFAGVSVDIFSSAFNLSIGISIIFVVIFPL